MSYRPLALVSILVSCARAPSPARCPEPPPAAAAPEAAAEVAEPAPPAEPPQRKLVLRAVGYADLPGWGSGTQGGALVALRRSCDKMRRWPDERSVGRLTGVAGTVGQWREACAAAATLAEDDHAAAREYFQSHFRPYLAMDNAEPVGRFTGYYEAELRGSRRRHGPYQTPLYRRPPELVMADLRDFTPDPKRRRIAGKVVRGLLKPYFDRAEIVGGALAGRGLELVWVDDAIDAFFVQIQGSGRVSLDRGGVMRVGYAAQNGHIYTAIGRELIADGQLTRETVSMQSIRAWLLEHPEDADEMMNRNRSYVFFEELGKKAGPLGSQGVVLTPERSLAIDREFIAQSTPIWIDSTAPVPGKDEERVWRKLVVAQDTGGAIRGPVRGDIYWGSGARAADIAGRTKSVGRYYLLLPTSVTVESLEGSTPEP